MVYQLFYPTVASALTSGPTQPEVQGFEPVGTTQMVDLFSGDFNYNIPLFELPGPDGGYPFNLAYHAGITMDQEASWVGLGWSLNPGAINRSMRGLPDDFNGDVVTVEQDMKPNTSTIIDLGAEYELFGLDKNLIGVDASLTAKFKWNSYKGFGLGFEPNLSASVGNFKANYGLSFNANEGVGLNAGISYNLGAVDLGVNASVQAIQGITSLGLRATTSGKLFSPVTVGHTFTFAGDAYTPSSAMGWTSNDFSVGVHVGADVFGTDLGGNLSGFHSTQTLKEPLAKIPSFGYMNMENANQNALTDVNREKDGTIFPNTSNLGSPIFTQDVYSVSGQGIGGSYRPKRSDIGVLSERRVVSDGAGGSINLEFDGGGGAKFGYNDEMNTSYSRSGDWSINSAHSLNNLKFKNSISGQPDYEPYYFQSAGEITAELISDYNGIGHDAPVKVRMDGLDYYTYNNTNYFKNHRNQNIAIDANVLKDKRTVRQSSIQPVTNEQLLDANNQEILGDYNTSYYTSINDYSNAPTNELSNSHVRNKSKYGSHIAGVTALQTNGTRYVYGIPAYNIVQEDYAFSIDGSVGSQCNTTRGIILDGNGDIDYKVSANGGALAEADDYYKRTDIPPYAHSYLLTSVLGTDYVDINNDGPSNDDLGYWVNFNYVKTSDETANGSYKWRSPYFGANFSEGNRGIAKDDKASFTYGEREQYYMATVETKTHIAKFEISPRSDARGAENRFQNDLNTINFSNTASSYRLDKIYIYSKLELAQNPTNPTPIKTVHFDYGDLENNNEDYTLCKRIDNSSSTSIGHDGKLTLKRLWFTHGNSTRGALSPYEFDYHEDEPSENPDYGQLHFDKWGNYKAITTNSGLCDNRYFPYTTQYDNSNSGFASDKNKEASVWNLKEIKLPSGARIKVDYEADDYAYEQDRVATQMFKVTDVKKNGSFGNILKAAANKNPNTGGNDRRVYFDQEVAVSSKEEVEDLYLKDLHKDEDGYHQLYYKVLIDLKDGSNSNEYQFVEGYAQIEEWGVESGKAYVQLKGIPLNLKNESSNTVYHPFTAAAWQILRTQFPDKVHENQSLNPPTDDDGIVQHVNDLLAVLPQALDIFTGFYSYCKGENYATDLDLSKSYIKLNSPDKKKYGGGVRVKQITFDDQWDANNEAPTMGQVYDYTTIEDEQVISSGVATKEPMHGGEESALRYAKLFTQTIPFKTPNNYFFEGPINESYYPGPSVGYSKVTVRSLATNIGMEYKKYVDSGGQEGQPLPANLHSDFAMTGVNVNEFYTAKDFPVITGETVISSKEKQPKTKNRVFFKYKYEHFTGSQGYTIELNDMHGKPKRVAQYALDNDNELVKTPINETIYHYYENKKDVKGKQVKVLDNIVPILLSDANPSDPTEADFVEKSDNKMQLGVDYEFFVDMRENFSTQSIISRGFNTNTIGIFPIFTLFPVLNYSESKTRTAVANKIIRRSGILKSIEVHDESSKVVTENKLFDALTGNAVLTSVYNNFDDEIYNYQISAYEKYDGMGPAYKNWGMKFNISGFSSASSMNCSSYEATVPNSDYIFSGDEFIILRNNIPEGIATVIEKDGSGTVGFEIDNSTAASNSTAELFLIRSGRRNLLDASVASISALKDPTKDRTVVSYNEDIDYPNGGSMSSKQITFNTYENKEVLNSSATIFKDNWAITDDASCNSTPNTNPYALGEKGVWRPYQSYAYVDERNASSNVDIRNDGTYDLTMFDWSSSSFPLATSNHNWKLTNEMTKYDKNGNEVENRNILGQYSSAIFGYDGNLSIAVAAK